MLPIGLPKADRCLVEQRCPLADAGIRFLSPLLGLDAFADVDHGADYTHRFSAVIANNKTPVLHMSDRPVPAQEPVFSDPVVLAVSFRVNRRAYALYDAIPVLRMDVTGTSLSAMDLFSCQYRQRIRVIHQPT